MRAESLGDVRYAKIDGQVLLFYPKVHDVIQRFSVFALLLVCGWIVMTFTHETGHLIGGYVSGANLVDYEIAPWRLPYSLHSPDPRPLVTLWAGPIAGVAIPVLLACILRCRWAWTIADFCVLANGCYLAVAWISGDHLLDTPRLLGAGASPTSIALFCIVSIGVGYVQFRSDCVYWLTDIG